MPQVAVWLSPVADAILRLRIDRMKIRLEERPKLQCFAGFCTGSHTVFLQLTHIRTALH